MLQLASETDGDWAATALAELGELLLDHAHCEKKAAGVAVSLIFRYPDHPWLMEPLSALAREELAHFEAVLEHLKRRGLAFGPQHPSPYAGRLRRIVRDGEPERLLDILLCSALIEARSCERLALLAGALEDPELAHFYEGLHAAEARHHGVYLELAGRLAESEVARARLREIAAHEAQVLAQPPRVARIHG